jgi:hypothetical protein
LKEDILEQLVDDYLQLNGFFTTHNVKFKPLRGDPGYVTLQDAVHSDVDVIGFNPLRKGHDRIWVVSCKSWQGGFNPQEWIKWFEADKRVMGRNAWRFFRELVSRKWADALTREIKRRTGSTEFTYVTAITRLKGKGDTSSWIRHPLFRKNLRGNPIKILTLKEILGEIYKDVSKTEASSDVGRLLQVIKASGWESNPQFP